MPQVSIILPVTDERCRRAVRRSLVFLQRSINGMASIDVRAPGEPSDEVVGSGAVRGWRATGERDHSVMLLLDPMVDDTSSLASFEEIVQTFVGKCFQNYDDVGKPQHAIYVGVQDALRSRVVNKGEHSTLAIVR